VKETQSAYQVCGRRVGEVSFRVSGYCEGSGSMASNRPGWADSVIPINMQAIVIHLLNRLAQDLDNMAPEFCQLIEEEDAQRARDKSPGNSAGQRLCL
jgi:hypothetical protein